MTKITRLGEIDGKSATEIYDASLDAFQSAGFEVWKKRPMAWLSMAKRKVDDQLVNANLAVRPNSPASYTLTVTSEGHDNETLQRFADTITESLKKCLKA